LSKFNKNEHVILILMKEDQKQNNALYLRKDLLKSLILSLVAIAIVVALYYVWK